MAGIPEGSLLAYCLSAVIADEAKEVLVEIGKERIDQINTSIATIVEKTEICKVMPYAVQPGDEAKSIVPGWIQPKAGLRMIRISDAASQLVVPLIGAAIAILATSGQGRVLQAIPSLAESVRVLWSNIVTLRTSIDADAILIVNKIAGLDVIYCYKKSSERASTNRLIARSGIGKGRVTSALRKLVELRLVSGHWAKQAGDFDCIENTWSIGL